jgi:hypothetical protein
MDLRFKIISSDSPPFQGGAIKKRCEALFLIGVVNLHRQEVNNWQRALTTLAIKGASRPFIAGPSLKSYCVDTFLENF